MTKKKEITQPGTRVKKPEESLIGGQKEQITISLQGHQTKQLFTEIFDGASLTDCKLQNIWAGNSWQKLFGRDIEKLEDTFKYIHSEDLSEVKRAWKGLKNGGRPFKGLICRYRDSKGVYRFYEFSVFTVTVDKECLFYVVVRDVDERMQAEVSLRINEERLRIAGQVAYDLIYEWDVEDGSLEWFGDIEKMLGYKEGKISRDIDGWLQLIHPGDRKRLKKAVELHKSSKKPIKYEYRVKHKSGQYRFWKDHAKVFLYKENEPRKWVGVCTDITEQKLAEQRIRESEKKYRLLVENAGEAVIVAQEGKLKFASRKVKEILGYKPHELIGKNFVDLIKEEDRKLVAERYEKRLKGEHIRRAYSIRAISKTDQTIWLEINAYSMRWEGKPAMLSLLTDITGRKKIEESFKYERDLVQMYIELAGVMFITLDKKGKVTLINQKGTEVLGYKREEILGKNWFVNFLPAGVRDEVRAIFEQLITGEIGPSEYRENDIIAKNGERRLIAWHNTILRDKDGNIAGTLSSGHDITERKRAEEELKQKVYIIESASSAIATADRDGNLTYVNPKVVEMWGYKDAGEIIGNPINKYLIFRAKFNEITEMLKTKGQWEGELQGVRKDGSLFDLQVSAALVLDGDGKPIGSMASAVDISDRKRAEEELRKHRDHLEDMVKDRTAELEEKNRELERFYDATVDREFRIRELREKIEDLEKKLVEAKRLL